MRRPCCDKDGTTKGAWSKQEDQKLIDYISSHGEGCWHSLPKAAGLFRCGKSCRLRWINYLRPDIKRGNFDQDEEDLIVKLHALLGNRWSLIAGRLPGRTDNEVKNYWNSHIRRKLIRKGIDPNNHRLNQIRPLSNQITVINNKSATVNHNNVVHSEEEEEEEEEEEVLSESDKNMARPEPITNTCNDKSVRKPDAATSSVEDLNLELTISVPNSASVAINGEDYKVGVMSRVGDEESAISTDAESYRIAPTTLLLFT